MKELVHAEDVVRARIEDRGVGTLLEHVARGRVVDRDRLHGPDAPRLRQQVIELVHRAVAVARRRELRTRRAVVVHVGKAELLELALARSVARLLPDESVHAAHALRDVAPHRAREDLRLRRMGRALADHRTELAVAERVERLVKHAHHVVRSVVVVADHVRALHRDLGRVLKVERAPPHPHHRRDVVRREVRRDVTRSAVRSALVMLHDGGRLRADLRRVDLGTEVAEVDEVRHRLMANEAVRVRLPVLAVEIIPLRGPDLVKRCVFRVPSLVEVLKRSVLPLEEHAVVEDAVRRVVVGAALFPRRPPACESFVIFILKRFLHGRLGGREHLRVALAETLAPPGLAVHEVIRGLRRRRRALLDELRLRERRGDALLEGHPELRRLLAAAARIEVDAAERNESRQVAVPAVALHEVRQQPLLRIQYRRIEIRMDRMTARRAKPLRDRCASRSLVSRLRSQVPRLRIKSRIRGDPDVLDREDRAVDEIGLRDVAVESGDDQRIRSGHFDVDRNLRPGPAFLRVRLIPTALARKRVLQTGDAIQDLEAARLSVGRLDAEAELRRCRLVLPVADPDRVRADFGERDRRAYGIVEEFADFILVAARRTNAALVLGRVRVPLSAHGLRIDAAVKLSALALVERSVQCVRIQRMNRLDGLNPTGRDRNRAAHQNPDKHSVIHHSTPFHLEISTPGRAYQNVAGA